MPLAVGACDAGRRQLLGVRVVNNAPAVVKRPWNRRGRGTSSEGRRGRSAQERGLGVAVDAAQRNLPRGRLDRRASVAFAALGALDFELGALVEGLVALQVRTVRVPPCGAPVVVYVAWRAEGHDERGSLYVVELLNVFGQDVDHLFRDPCQHDTLDVALADGLFDFGGEPLCQLIVIEVAHSHECAVAQGQRPLVRYGRPVTSCDVG